MSRASGSPGLIGSTAFVNRPRPGLMLSDKIFRLLISEEMNSRYIVWLFNSRIVRTQIEQAVSGAEGLANNLPQSRVKNFVVPCPPYNEQKEIVSFLQRETARLDALTAEAAMGIMLLQERRTALISAAVTGKIDVRSLITPATAKEAVA